MKKFIASAVTVVAAFMLSSCGHLEPISIKEYEPIVDLKNLAVKEICEKRYRLPSEKEGEEGKLRDKEGYDNCVPQKSENNENEKKKIVKKNYKHDLEECRELAEYAKETYKQRYDEEVRHDAVVAIFRTSIVMLIGVAAADTRMGLAAGLLEIPSFTSFVNSAISSRNEHPRTSEAYQLARHGAAQIVDKCMDKRGYPLLFDIADSKGKVLRPRGLCTDKGKCDADDNK